MDFEEAVTLMDQRPALYAGKEATMRTRWIHAAALGLGCMAGSAWADGGLTIDADSVPWPRLQTRIGLSAATPLSTDASGSNGYALQGARVLGDYYFSSGPMLGSQRLSGGFRATSGVMLNSSGASLSMPTVPRPGWTLSVSQQSSSYSSLSDPAADTSTHAVPYLGVGYTGLSPRGGWGFTADVGLMALNPGSGLKLGKLATGTQSLDDLLRELRLTPVLQLGVSYSF
jgi:hypothetical protein